MKNQRMTTEARSFGVAKIAIVLLMIATLLCSFTVIASAQTSSQVTVGLEDLSLEGVSGSLATGFTKEYNGSDTVTVTVASGADLGIAAADDVTVVPTAKLSDKNAGARTLTISFTLTGADKDKYQTPNSIAIPVEVTPKTLSWTAGSGATATVVYVSGVSAYENVSVTLPTLDSNGIVNGDSVAPQAATVNVNGVAGVGSYTATAVVALNNPNYRVAPVTVEVSVAAATIDRVEWAAGGAITDITFDWNDDAALALKLVGYDDDTNETYELIVVYPNGYGTVGTHTITVASPDPTNVVFGNVSDEYSVVIRPATYTVSMGDASVIGTSGLQTPADLFNLVVAGDIPADIRAQIVYKVNGAPFAGATEFGAYTVTAVLPTSDNYSFKNANGDVVTTLQATLYINKKYIPAGSADAPYQLILIGENGFAGEVTATVVDEGIVAKRALRGFRVHTEYKLTVTGAANETYTVVIPVSNTLYHKRCDAPTVADLYIYEEATGEMKKASELGYTVSLEDGYYTVEGVNLAASLTFVIAPTYHVPFWLTAPGIALMILFLLALIALMLLVGLYLLRLRREENEAMVIDTEGEVAEVVPAEVPELVEDPDAKLEENAEEIAESIEVEAPEAEQEAEGVEEVVEESMQQLLDEAAEVELEKPAEDDSDVAAEMAEEKAEALADEVDSESPDAEADEEALRAAVAEALAESANESADATDAVEIVEEEEAPAEDVQAFAEITEEPKSDDDDDNDDDDNDNDFFGGFGSMPLDFIDAVENADEYNAMLEQERNGEIRIVTRYRRSFQSRLIQSQGNVQEYYNALKNALLSYKGVKNRISWNYEAFNRGRVHVAKLNAKTKTLYLYLALDPEELKDTKYGIVDVSSKKKYASVPVLMKIKGERKFKYALELIEKLCGENLQLPKLEGEEVDYRVPYQTTEELVEAGVVKKLVASVPLTALLGAETPAEEAPAEETAPEAKKAEPADVTFVEPTTATAVEEAAEEPKEI